MTDPQKGPGDERLGESVRRALSFLLAQQKTRTPWKSSVLTPNDPAIDRFAAGTWAGTFTVPGVRKDGPDYTPVIVTAPLYFPLIAGRSATFNGLVDAPFASMDGWIGRRNKDGAADARTVENPESLFGDGGANWGSYFVVGSVDGVTQFVTRAAGNRSWKAEVANVVPGSWSFQLVTYANAAAAARDADRIAVGAAWRQADRPGDARQYWTVSYADTPPQFSNVVLDSAGPFVIRGTLEAFAAVQGRTYRILVTNEADGEYAWALADAVPGTFAISRDFPFDGRIKLRLVELLNGCSVRVVGQVWAEENAAAGASCFPDLRIEYRSLTTGLSAVPDSTVPARRDGTWSVTLVPKGVGRVSLVDVNTRRICGEYTMPSGLLRSFIVPAADSGQRPIEDVYYDAFNDTCFLYDQAVALIAFLQLGERAAARQLVNALLTVQNPDGSFPFANQQATLSAHEAGVIRNGAQAWVCYALLIADQPPFRDWFAERPTAAALAGLDYALDYTNTKGLIDGGRGRIVEGVLEADYVVPWWSTEHNIDLWWALDLAARLYGSKFVNYAARADALKAALLENGVGWDGATGLFWQGGIVSNGVNKPDGMRALDTHSWGAALLEKWGLKAAAAASLARANGHYAVTDTLTGLQGFTTFISLDGYPPDTIPSPWYEGSFGVVIAWRDQDPSHATDLLGKLVTAQNPDGSYPYVLRADPVNDIHTFPCIIAAGWNVLAWSGSGTPYPRIVWV